MRNEYLETDLLDRLLSLADDNRPQPSATSLIYCLTKGWYDQHQPLPYTQKTKTYFVVGLLLEQALIGRLQEHEQNVDRVHVSKDGIYYHPDSLIDSELLEVKSTRMRAKTEPDGFPQGWLRQFMCYLYCKKLLYGNFAIIHLIEPVVQCWSVEFTQEELDENWAWMLERKLVWDMYKDADIPPAAFEWNDGESENSWECKGCSYLWLCSVRKGKEVTK